ncbi:MAG: hybrid sensor histidine kinase/response regulator [Bryobacteraceae bacterium]|jgi:DNA-binding response OmpR family regulator
MVVDDQPANLKLLEDLLRNRGYRVHSFPRGRLALAAAAQNPPDLILLDINMPEMNGYEVCDRLKANAKLKAIPVIFLSALSEVSDKLKAFQSGGVDYISKPFQFEEVQARVDTHVQLHHLQRSLQQHNDRLEEIVGLRTRELGEAHARLKILDQAKTDFLTLISHEFRTPLGGLLGVGELLLEECGADGELRDMFEQSRRRILCLLEDAAVLSEIEFAQEKLASECVAVSSVLDGAITRAAAFAKSRHVTLEAPPCAPTLVQGRQDLLVKALQSLVETAVRFSDPGTAVRVACHGTQVSIDGGGRTIPASAIPKFFDLLSIREAITPDGDFGIGPAVAHRILSLFGGSVAVRNRDSSGMQLTVSLKSAYEEGGGAE